MDNIPDFDTPAPTEPPAPKKPRRKPTKTVRRVVAPPKPAKKRRKRVVAPSRKHEPETLRMIQWIGIYLRAKALLAPIPAAERQALLKVLANEP